MPLWARIVITVILLLVVGPILVRDVKRTFHRYLLCAVPRKFLKVKKLRVEQTFHVDPGTVVERLDVWLDENTFGVTLENKYPTEEMWVASVSFRVWPIRIYNILISIDQATYEIVKPGDMIENPHLGKYNPEAWVDPRIVFASQLSSK